MTPDKALTAKEAALILGIALGTLYNMRQRRQGPPFSKIGGKIVYRERDVLRYIAKHTTDPERQET